MSSSYNCEEELRRLAEELHRKAYSLEEAAETLKTLRDSNEIENKIKSAKQWAKQSMESYK